MEELTIVIFPDKLWYSSAIAAVSKFSADEAYSTWGNIGVKHPQGIIIPTVYAEQNIRERFTDLNLGYDSFQDRIDYLAHMCTSKYFCFQNLWIKC